MLYDNMTQSKNRPVKTTATSLELLEKIKELDGATVGELEAEMELGRTTIHNHLQTLLDFEYVSKENNTYEVGLRLLHLGQYARTCKREYDLAKRAVETLASETQLEADFNVEEHGRLINLFDIVGPASDSGWEVGTFFNMHSTAAGKALLAELSKDRVEEILDTHGLPAQTERTITDRDELFRQLEVIQERGYAINDGECYEGYKTIGKAVTYPDGSIFGGLAVGGPAYIIGEQFDTSIQEALKTAVADLESDVETEMLPG
jgi:DNA-binding IclR family transcriptional regulator